MFELSPFVGLVHVAAAPAPLLCSTCPAAPAGDTLLPASLTERLTPEAAKPKRDDEELDASKVFAKLSALKGHTDDDDE